MNSKLKLLLLFVAAFSRLNTYAQEESAATWLTSDMSNMNVNTGNIIQKDLARGTANITIPFYSYSNSGIDLSVSMSYNTQAMQVDRIASNIGLGWELNAGGYIQREIRGFADDVKLTCPTINNKKGYWYATATGCTNLECDEESDIFHVVIGNRSFKFLFSKTGELLTIPKSNDVLVERRVGANAFVANTTAMVDGADTRFIITDEAKNKFYFEKVYRNEYQHKILDPDDHLKNCYQYYFPIQKWALSRVETFEGQVIEYYFEGNNLNTFNHMPQSVFANSEEWLPPFNAPADGAGVVEISRLTKIEYPNNIDVIFQYSAADRCDLYDDKRMTGIKIQERSGPSGKIQSQFFTFDQSLFASPDIYTAISTSFNNTTSTPVPKSNGDCPELDANGNPWNANRHRLKLNQVNFGVNSGTSRKLYFFEYSNMPLPQRGATRDKYGRANNSIFTYHNPPDDDFMEYLIRTTIGTGSSAWGANKNVSALEYVEACMLKKITNANSGQIELKYTTAFTEAALAIDEIKTYDGYNHDNDIITKYHYGDIESIPSAPMKYDVKVFEPELKDYTCWLSSDAILNEALNGSRYVFKTVTEDVLDKNTFMLKRTIYTFSGFGSHSAINGGNDDNAFAGGTDYNTVPFSNKQYYRAWGVGLPLSITYYDRSQLLQSTHFKYNVTEEHKNTSSFACSASVKKWFESSFTNTILTHYTDSYYPYTGTTQLVERTIKEYTASFHFFQKTTTLTYDAHGNIKSETYNNSLGQPVTKKYFYNYDWGTGVSQAYDFLLAQGIKRPLFTETWKNNKLVDVNIPNLYRPVPANNKIIRASANYSLKGVSALTTGAGTNTNLSSLPSNPYLRLTSVTAKYDEKGYLLESTDASQTRINATIWDNLTGTQLASAVNASYDEIAYCGYESAFQPDNNGHIKWGNWEFKAASITSNSNDVFLGRQAYHLNSNTNIWSKPAGLRFGKYIVSFWVKNGSANVDVLNSNPAPNQVTMVQVDEYNGWKLFKGEFAISSATGNVSLFSSGAYIDELRLYPADALMTNINTLPLIGKTADVDANDRIIRYEYDDMGQLSVTRDHNGNIITKVEQVTQGQD